jgi:hypothetical protein
MAGADLDGTPAGNALTQESAQFFRRIAVKPMTDAKGHPILRRGVLKHLGWDHTQAALLVEQEARKVPHGGWVDDVQIHAAVVLDAKEGAARATLYIAPPVEHSPATVERRPLACGLLRVSRPTHTFPDV